MRVLFLVFSFLIFDHTIIRAQNNEVNASKFGLIADGKTDNSLAFKTAFEYCIKNGVVCYIPKASKSYLVKNTVYVDIPPTGTLQIRSNGAILEYADQEGFNSVLLWKLSPIFKERAMIAIGPKAKGSILAQAFTNEMKNSLIVEGLRFEGRGLPFKKGTLSKDDIILSALDFSVDKVILKELIFSNIMGYGLRSFGVKELDIQKVSMNNVGGRSKPSDAFGDGIFIAVVKNNANITIDHVNLEGAFLNGARSRSGMTFEFTINPYQVKISNASIINYAKSLHFEEKAKSNIRIDNCTFSKFNYAIAMVANTESVCNIYNSTFNCSGTDKMDHGDGGPTLNTDRGGKFNFYNSVLNLNGRNNAYITSVGVQLFEKCIINGFNKNPYFADTNCTFESCKFIDFGGSSFSFFSYGMQGATFTIRNSKFIGGGPVHARGQRVNLSFKQSKSEFALQNQKYNN